MVLFQPVVKEIKKKDWSEKKGCIAQPLEGRRRKPEINWGRGLSFRRLNEESGNFSPLSRHKERRDEGGM